jgi:CDP-6-deoxy-D-xylo-4-hexulose-3-dehydrase
MRTYPLASSTWGKEELDAIQSVIDSDMYTMGAKVKQFEKEFAEYFESPYAVMTNSGSSANLIMMSCLQWRHALNTRDIIVPALGWSTSYFPVIQNNIKLNFVDINSNTFNIDPAKIEEAITPNTKAILAINMLGNPCNFTAIKEICVKHQLLLLEDNCESMGAKWKGRYTGTLGFAGTFSFFFSHHIQTMEGGMILTPNEEDAHYMRSLRTHGWCRDLPAEGAELYKRTGDPFYDSFTFVTPGYCVRPLEMSGAVGSEQLKKFPKLLWNREQNKKYFEELFGDVPWARMQTEHERSSWFTFGLVLQGELKGQREMVINHLTAAGVQSRPIGTQNMMRQPVMNRIRNMVVPCDDRNFDGVEDVHENGFMVGNHGNLDCKEGIFRMFTEMKKLV